MIRSLALQSEIEVGGSRYHLSGVNGIMTGMFLLKERFYRPTLNM